jgi:hypothetical protein
VITGGILGVILMRFAAAIFIKLLEKFPRFELSAYLLVIVIGMKLLLDWGFNSDWKRFPVLDKWQHQLVETYDQWLNQRWPLTPAAFAAKQRAAAAAGHTPHLLDFHAWWRPEFIAFWLLMVVCFLIGFTPVKRHGSLPSDNSRGPPT